MEMEKNMERNLPSFILAMDIKGGYNNVNLQHLEATFEKRVLQELPSHNQQNTLKLMKYITRSPQLKIWRTGSTIQVTKGLLQGGVTSPMLFILYADPLTTIPE